MFKTLQTSFKQDVSNEEWLLIKALKPVSLTAVGSSCRLLITPLQRLNIQ